MSTKQNAGVMISLPAHVRVASIELIPGVPLNVFLVKGGHYSVWIDSGIRSMFPILKQTMEEAGVAPDQLRFILNTHSHHDHIGCNAQLKRYCNCLVAAPSAYVHWHSDFERHFQEFARPFPDIFSDTPELRREVLELLDEPHAVDVRIDREMVFDLGGGVQLQALGFAGHMLAELGWLETSSRTLILGDVITLMDAPFIHGHLTVFGYRLSLQKIRQLIEDEAVEQVLMAHFPPQSAEEVFDLSEKADRYLDRLEAVIIEILEEEGSLPLESIWRFLCKKLGKQLEFRSLSTVDAHLKDLAKKGVVVTHGEPVYSLIH